MADVETKSALPESVKLSKRTLDEQAAGRKVLDSKGGATPPAAEAPKPAEAPKAAEAPQAPAPAKAPTPAPAPAPATKK